MGSYLEKSPMNETSQDVENAVAIVGMTGRFPGSPTVSELWASLMAGREGLTFFEEGELDPSVPAKLRANPGYVHARGILADIEQFDPAFFGMSPLEASIMDPQQRLLLEAAWNALEDAGIVPDTSEDLIGVWVGTNWNTYFTSNVLRNEKTLQRYGEFNARLANENDFPASRISYKLNLKGPSVTVNTACSTSLVAVIEAVRSLRNYECDAALAGGVSVSVPNRVGYLHQKGGMLSKDGHCRPFDASATGTTFNDGLAMVVLKRLDDAIQANDRIYALIRGTGINNDGSDKVSYTAPSVQGQRAALELAIADADIDPQTVGFIETHGTATPLGDPIEVEAIRMAYGDDAEGPRCILGSVKSNIGHSVHAAGATGLIKASLALESGQIPPTLFFEKLNPTLGLEQSRFEVNAAPVGWPQAGVRRASVSSFGVGGTNAHVVLEQYRALAATPRPDAIGPSVLPLSAKSRSALISARKSLGTTLESTDTSLRDTAYTLTVRRAAFEHRMACVAGDRTHAVELLKSERADAVVWGKAREFERLVFAFPGQGAQFPGMAAHAHRESISFREAFDVCMTIAQDLVNEDLRGLLLTETPTKQMGATLAQTRLAQPALFAVGYSLAQQFLAMGLEPAALIGHSIGEYVAAALAGVMSLEDAVGLVVERGRLMQAQPPGSMLAVSSDPESLAPCLSGVVELAAINAPESCVLTGPTGELAEVQRVLADRGLKVTPLKTSHAFHSAMMEGALAEFRDAVRQVKLSAPKIPIASTKTGSWLGDEEAISPEYWSDQIREPVRFSDALTTLLDAPTCMLELGPGNTLSALAMMQADPRHAFVSSLGTAKQPRAYPVAETVARLWVDGLVVPWDALMDLDGAKLADLPTYAFDRRACWIDPDATRETVADEASSHGSTDLSAPAQGAQTSARDRLVALFSETTGVDLGEAEADRSFSELGLDSLSLTQVAIAIEDTFRVEISFRQLGETLSSLGTLTAYVEEHGSDPEPGPSSSGTSPGVPSPASAAGLAVTTLVESMKRSIEREARPSDDRPASLESWDDLGASRAESLRRFIEEHCEKTQQSKLHTQRYRGAHADPRTAAGYNKIWKEIVYPLVCNRSSGPHLWDLDGNRYIDLLSGFGPNMLGHAHPRVMAAVAKQLQEGIEIGPQSHLAGATAELVCELTKMDRASFVCTGSEAVQAAMRCVRTFTRRDKIVLFRGDYHGNFDEVLVRGVNGKGFLRTRPSAPGIPKSNVNDIIELEYGNPSSLEVLREIQHLVAGVMVEPVQSRRPEFQPRDFLHEVRTICDESGAQLIFDEVVTGFRCHPGGAQAVFGVKADIATYGKVVAGNLPIGIVAGRREVMDTFDGGDWRYGDDSGPEAAVTFFAGTFARHPLAIAACYEMLSILKEEGPALQERLAARTSAFAGQINAVFQERDLPFELPHFASVMYLRNRDWTDLGSLLWYYLRHHGLFMLEGFPSYMTEAHTDAVLAEAKEAFVTSLDEMLEAKLLPKARSLNRDIGASAFDATKPPVPGARLGRDCRGRPAWFVADENDPKKFVQVEVSR